MYIALLWVTIMSPGLSYANEREFAVKAGFIFNFARYSEGSWFNPNRSDRYTICSFNPQFVLTASKTLKNQKVKNRPVEVHLVSVKGIPNEICNSFYLTSINDSLIGKVVDNPKLSNTMLIGENKKFIQSGGHINLFITGGKVRFEVDANALASSGIKMSSKVLRLGRVVERGSEQ